MTETAKPKREYRRLYTKEAPAPTLADRPYRMTLVIQPEIADVLRSTAADERRPINDIVRAALLAYFAARDQAIALPVRNPK